MLIKKELSAVQALPCGERATGSMYYAAAQITDLPKSGRILDVDFYRDKDLVSRFFCDGKTYTVLDVAKNSWTINYPLPGCSWYYQPGITVEKSSEELIRSFLREGSRWSYGGVQSVFSYIYHKKCEKRDTARQNMYDLMKRHMAMFPGFPKNLKEYCNANVFDRRYIFVAPKDKKGIRTARCSCCGKEFRVGKEAVSGKNTVCPACGRTAVYRATWIKSDVQDKADICICYNVDGQLLIRWAHVVRRYGWPEFEQNYQFDDFAYSLYLTSNGKQRIYTYKYFKAPYAYDYDWHRLNLDDYCTSSSFVYTDNLNDVFGERYYNVDLQAGLSGKRISLQFVSLLNNLKNTPKAEYLFKMGLPLLAASAITLKGDPEGKGKFMQEIGVSKQYLPLYRDMNVTPDEHNVIKESPEWITAEILQRYRGLHFDKYGAVPELVKQFGVSKTISYLEKQQKLHPKVSLNRMADEFRDYLHMSRDLKVDMSHKSVRFPADIIEAHKTVTERYNAAKLEIEKEKRKEEDAKFSRIAQQLYAEYRISEYGDGKFCVVFPKLRTDLIAEGQSLNHCVGIPKYAQQHLEGKNMIFFIRKASEPEKPFFTMELDMLEHRIKQLYGFGDCSAPKAVREFANKFVTYTVKAMSRKTA